MERAEFGRIVGDNIRRYRDRYNLTQEQFAEKTGISKAQCASIETGKKIPSSFTIRKIADALELSVEYFLYKEPPPQEDGQRDEQMRRINSALRYCSPGHLEFIEDILFSSRKFDIILRDSANTATEG